MFYLICVTLVFFSLKVCHQDKKMKILGGVLVKNRSEIPYQVLVRLSQVPHCGGFILDLLHIGTAAHCLTHLEENEEDFGKPFKPEFLDVVVGNLLLDDIGISRVGRQVILHPDWDIVKQQADIGILRLKEPFETWTKLVQPFKLARRTPHGVCRVAGWGKTDKNKRAISDHLMYTEVKIVDLDSCTGTYQSLNKALPVHVICAGSSGKDSCAGDSGGALVCNNEIAGIVSFGYNCGVNPGIYTDVSFYYDWIQTELRKFPQERSKCCLSFSRPDLCLYCIVFKFLF